MVLTDSWLSMPWPYAHPTVLLPNCAIITRLGDLPEQYTKSDWVKGFRGEKKDSSKICLLFMIYFTTLSLPSPSKLMVELLVDNEMKGVRKEPVVNWGSLPPFLEGLRISRGPSIKTTSDRWISNPEPSKYTCRVLHLQQLAQSRIYSFQISRRNSFVLVRTPHRYVHGISWAILRVWFISPVTTWFFVRVIVVRF